MLLMENGFVDSHGARVGESEFLLLLQPDAVHRPDEVEHVDADRLDATLGVGEGGRSVALENAEGGDCLLFSSG